MWADDINRASPDGEASAKLRDWADRFEAAHQREVTEAATVAPERNCDHYKKYLDAHGTFLRFCHSFDRCDEGCPLHGSKAKADAHCDCFYAWLFMEYKPEDKK